MVDKKAIHEFAKKWCDKFRDQKVNYIELVDHYMADDCEALGFVMDCGNAFGERYGKAGNDYEALDRIIDDIDDIPLLGSAIYSQWRYFNHWAYSGEEILEPQNRAWFILALSRLAILTGDNPFIFQGILQKIRIISNCLGYGPVPEPDDEAEQHLTINAEGRVWFSSYNYGDGSEKYKKASSRNFKIEQSVTNRIFQAFSTYFSDEYTEVYAADIGDWTMELTNTEGKVYRFRGSLCAEFVVDGDDLSDLIRDSLDMDNLFVFDGNAKPEKMTRICLDYHRVTKIVPREIPDNVSWDHVTWDYSERLIIDGTTETVEYIANIGSGCRASHRYEVEEGVNVLLDELRSNDFLRHIEGNPDDVIDNPNETKDYTITIDYVKSPRRVISGSFDKRGLPDDFAEFADTVREFIEFYNVGEIFNPAVYGKSKRRKSDLIFCSVEFNEGDKTYYYLTDDDAIDIGDSVVVPAGKDNHQAVVKVVDIEYFTEDSAPLPVEKVKRIIRKWMEDELDVPNDIPDKLF